MLLKPANIPFSKRDTTPISKEYRRWLKGSKTGAGASGLRAALNAALRAIGLPFGGVRCVISVMAEVGDAARGEIITVSAVKDQLLSPRVRISRERLADDEIQIRAWLYQPSIADLTRKEYARVIRAFFESHWNCGLKEITTAHVSLYLKQREDLSPITKNFQRNVLSSLYQFLANTGYVQRNPIRAVKNAKIPESFQFKDIPRPAIDQMHLVAKNDRDKLIVHTLYYTSVRVSELISIKLSSFTPHATAGATLTIVGKGSSTRSLLTGRKLWREIRSYQQQRGLGPDDYLFYPKGDPKRKISRVMVWKIVKAISKKANIDLGFGRKPSPHWFRHASSMAAIENGAPINVVQQTLGHKSIETTGKYLRARPKKSSSDFLE